VITALREWRVGTDASGEATAPTRRWWLDLRILAPIFAAAIYVAIVAVRFPSIISSFYQYSDFPEALRLGDAVFHGGWGQGLALPSQNGIGPLWTVGLLNQVTGNEVAGMALGAGMVVLATGFMVVTARRVLGATRAIAVGALCLAAPPVVAWVMLNPIAHESTLLLAAVYAWHVVALSEPGQKRRIGSSIAVGALAGVCIVSDPLALAAAVAPWVICAAMLTHRRRESRLPLLLTLAASATTAVCVVVLSTASGIVQHGNTVVAPTIDAITSGLNTMATTLGQMLSGAWYSNAIGGALAVVGITAFAALLYIACREVVTRTHDATDGRDIYVVFWVVSSAALVAALCLSGLGVQHSPVNYQGHYLDGLWFAIAALLPMGLLHVGLARRLVAIAIPCLVLAAAFGIARMPAYPFQGPDYVDAPRLAATLEQLGVAHGYGGYWESYAFGWNTGQRVTVLPLQQCADQRSALGLCAYEFAAPAWYVARAGPVFVVVLRGSCNRDDLCIDASNLASLPPPVAVRNVGLLQVDVYAHDVFAGLPMASRP